jgi:circadian clock protein KaiB
MKRRRRKATNAGRLRRPGYYILRLYVTGITGRSVHAIRNVKRVCDEHLRGRYALEVIDLYKNLPLARKDDVIAVPTLIKSEPLPLKRMIGDMSDETRLLAGLDIRPAKPTLPH